MPIQSSYLCMVANMPSVVEHQAVQHLAKSVLERLGSTIVPADTEASIAERLVTWLAEVGVTQTWYYDCPALVLLGSRSCLSISGRDYLPAREPVGQFNLVTVDLSPVAGGVWGDCARSFAIEAGRHTTQPMSAELSRGLQVLHWMHGRLREVASPDMTCDELFSCANDDLRSQGFENLDFLGNVGHSIESHRDTRRYVERGNSTPLQALGMFTFEPHIRQHGSQWGFKREDIYYFESNGSLAAL